MVTVARSARIQLHGFRTEGIDAYSALEDQVALTYRAVYHFADANHFQPYVHRGIQGRSGPMVMKRITDTLFEHADSGVRDKINGLVSQVLRKTDAAVCIRRPDNREETPTWFVADAMPPNLTIVALSHAHKETTTGTGPSSPGIIPTRTELRLTPEQAGETMSPGEVTIKHAEPKRVITPAERILPLKESHERAAQLHREMKAAVFAAVSEHQPVTAHDIRTLVGHFTTEDSSSVRNCLHELTDEGHVMSRVEEDDERLIRGGGLGYPKGKRVNLWGLTPGPVPKRTALPPGISPAKSAAEWDKEKSRQLDAWCDAIIEVLQRQYPAGSSRPRSIGTISAVAGLDHSQTKAALERLIKIDLVYMNENYCYFLAERRRPVKAAGTEPTIPPYANGSADQEAAKEAASQPEAPVQVAEPGTLDDMALTTEIMKLVAKHRPAGDLEQLREQLQAAQATIAKQAKIIAGLRGAIAAFEE